MLGSGKARLHQQLSADDARFLAAEPGHARAHVTLVHIYDPSTAPGGKVRFKAILAQIESRLHLAPAFRQRLLHMPLELDRPYWADDESFDIESHVSHVALPKPGDWRQFCIMAARIHARGLDMERSPWEMHVIEGLDTLPGLPMGSFALLTKVHHFLIGGGGAGPVHDLSSLIHDASAQAAPPGPPAPWFPRPAPRAEALMLRPRIGSLQQPPVLAWPLLRALDGMASISRAMAHAARTPVHRAATRFNAVVSGRRVFDTRRFEFDAFRKMRRLAPQATINDCALAVCGGALRRYLARHAELPELGLTAVLPFLTRNTANTSDFKSKVDREQIDLGTSIDDPVDRLVHICEQTASSRLRERAVSARDLADVERHSASSTLAMSGKVVGMAASDKRQLAPLANCSVINVPGPSTAQYLVGARLAYFSGLMPICDGMGLAFVVTSYDGCISISVTSCREQLPDPAEFSRCLQESFDEYASLVIATPRKRKARSASASAKA